MGVYNEQGAALEDPEIHNMLVKEDKRGSSHRCRMASPFSLRRQLSKVPPKDVFSDMMFIVGGWTKDDPSCLVEQFCPEYNEWRTAARMVNSRGNVAVGTLDGNIYTVGGGDPVRCHSNVERYNPDIDSWSTDVAPLNGPRSGVCLVAMDGYLYAIGGHDGTAALNTVERYDPKMNMWSKQVPMLTRRSRAVAAELEGHLYVIGGNDGDMVLSSVERYNPVDGTWSICPHMLNRRENAGCVVYLGHIYVAGGKDELNLELCSVERLDPDKMRWTPVKRMRSKRDDMSLVVFNGTLLAVGGSDGNTSLKTIEVYCHETNAWRHFGSMKSKHPGGRAAVLCRDSTTLAPYERDQGVREID